jgi:acyl dehydratase
VRPGDTLTAWIECIAKVPSKSKPDIGVIHEQWGATNQKGEQVLTAKGLMIVRRKPA